MIERRYVKCAEVRAKDGAEGHIEGHAAVFNEEYVLWDSGSYRVVETVKPGSFTRALKEKQDVRCLYNHEPDNLLGRSKAKTLELKQDKSGLYFDCEMPDTQMGRDVSLLVKRGDLDGCSFGFSVTKQTWREELENGKTTSYREIEDVDLFDVSPVTYPAYQGTDVSVRELRSAFAGLPDEMRSRLPKDVLDVIAQREQKREKNEKRGSVGADEDCRCACAPCQTGDCVNCTEADCDDENCDHAGDERSRMLDQVDARMRLAGMKVPAAAQ